MPHFALAVQKECGNYSFKKNKAGSGKQRKLLVINLNAHGTGTGA